MERPLADLTYVVKELPLGPSFPTGQLHDISSGMRTFRPVIDTEKCVKCLRCFLVCPDGAIDKSGAALEIDGGYGLLQGLRRMQPRLQDGRYHHDQGG